MKVKSAKKTASTKKSAAKNIFKSNKKAISALSNTDLVDVEIISSPSNNNASGRMELSVSSISEKLVGSGFDKIEIVSETEFKEKTPKKASPQQIEEMLKSQKSAKKPEDEKSFEIDLTKSIDKKKLPSLANNSVLEVDDDDEEIEIEFVKSSSVQLKSPIIPNSSDSPQTSQRDSQGILEVRLGKFNKSLAKEATSGLSNQTLDMSDGTPNQSVDLSKNSFNVSKSRTDEIESIPEEEPLLKVLRSKVTNSGNKRAPKLSRREDIAMGTSDIRKNIQRPLIKSIKRTKKQRIKSEKIQLDLPGPRAKLSVKMTNRKTGRVYRKSLRPRRLQLIPFRTTYPFKSDLNLPKINITYLDDSQVLVHLSKINPRIESLSIYRREISRKVYDDEYELINTIDDPPDSYSFIDDIENARAFKYVCVADGLPLYSYQIYRNRGFSYENIQEPIVFAYQARSNVVIEIQKFPSFYRKLMVFRKSSAEDFEELVDAISLYGRGRRRIRLFDDPVPIEQTLEYKLVGIDEQGIESVLEERPIVVYTAQLGRERANIINMSARYNQTTNEVDISGEIRVENLFMATSDAELKNPGEDTLKAASRGQNIVKIQIRRINLKTEEDEIILKEIINPGISKFQTSLRSLNRLTFNFSDSGENALTFDYTPLFDMTDYVYIARAIVYPLGVELRKVSDFEKIEGIRGPGRLPYEFDPAIFDHPLNVELGILPSSANSKSYEEADIIGATSRSIVRRVKVLQSDVEDSINLEAEIKSDSVFDPVVVLTGKIPAGMVDDLDHVAIEMEYDTVRKKDIIDRLFLIEPGFTYYDYSFDDLSCNEVKYSLIGIGKDFKQLFRSEPVSISLKDPKIKLITARKKSYGQYLRFLKQKEAKKAKYRLRKSRFARRRSEDNG